MGEEKISQILIVGRLGLENGIFYFINSSTDTPISLIIALIVPLHIDLLSEVQELPFRQYLLPIIRVSFSWVYNI